MIQLFIDPAQVRLCQFGSRVLLREPDSDEPETEVSSSNTGPRTVKPTSSLLLLLAPSSEWTSLRMNLIAARRRPHRRRRRRKRCRQSWTWGRFNESVLAVIRRLKLFQGPCINYKWMYMFRWPSSAIKSWRRGSAASIHLRSKR
jgi:hypothetical protein